MLNRYKFDPVAVATDLEAKRAALKANKGMSDFTGFAAGVIRRRLEAKPAKYREFGPYWWAVKKVLNEAGADFGQAFDVVIGTEYKGETPEATLVMGEAFKDIYRATFFVGNNLFQLEDGSPVNYELFDADMESRKAA
jgi:hypothetical protein